ncbi:glucokinase [Sinisalibacter aestuarii]|uniref:Glucokinase n=1 Tax=Sinisalibacter aestuarii TaxID=2949426 RepID=A0ABQ5LSV1_9RHOB|nr:glucokinase [Sinisalibacter aestuarii]GKY87693.1 glucokinase [Sinisalibacter aestuarii]
MVTGPADTYSLLADIGGTNTRVALARGTELLPDTIRKYRNADYPGLETVLSTFLAEEGNPDCAGACVAAAGPVRDGVATLTNLDWTIDGETVARAAHAETVAVLNDLQAQGHALGHLAPEALTTILDGPDAGPQAAKLVIGLGTGFNCAPVYETPGGRYVPPAEAGHANLPIRTEAELELCRELENVHGFPSVEEVLSGRGLVHTYAWLARRAGNPREVTSAGIFAAAESGSDPVAEETLRLFVKMFGTVTGNLSLIHLPFGGIFLIGGMARAVTPWLGPLGYGEAMRDKGRFSGFMKNFPVYVIEDDYAALTGCAHHLAARLAR